MLAFLSCPSQATNPVPRPYISTSIGEPTMPDLAQLEADIHEYVRDHGADGVNRLSEILSQALAVHRGERSTEMVGGSLGESSTTVERESDSEVVGGGTRGDTLSTVSLGGIARGGSQGA